MRGVRVSAKDAQRVKGELKGLGVLESGARAVKEEGFVIFPVTSDVEGYDTVSMGFERHKRHRKFKEELAGVLSPDELSLVNRAFDVVGDIAIIEVPEELKGREGTIAEALLKSHGSVRAVYKKLSGVKGEERVRDLMFLRGKEGTETTYVEHGMKLRLDIEKVYFSPRLSAERERILSMTKEGEVVVDMFAGIGPFSILLARNRDVKVYAIDVNEAAFEYLKENIRINKVADRVKPLFGDCRALAPKGMATRVIMNLPKSSDLFLGLAFDCIKEGVIHYYAISPEEDLYASKVDFIRGVADEKGRKIEILGTRKVRPYAPYTYHVAIDIGVKI